MIVMPPVITVDGPSGAGKGTLCKALAKTLQWHLLDSGAIYRVLALSALHRKVATNNEKELVSVATHLDVYFKIEHGQLKVILEGKDVSQVIRNENLSNIASRIALFPSLREELLHVQRTFRTVPGLIADGRDMGTVVFPDALVKIFLDASIEERTRRRMRQLQEKGFSVNFKYLLSEIKKRDRRDRHRVIAPLIPASNALVFDSTCLSIERMVAKALIYAKQVLVLS